MLIKFIGNMARKPSSAAAAADDDDDEDDDDGIQSLYTTHLIKKDLGTMLAHA